MGSDDSAVSDAEKKPEPNEAQSHPDEISSSRRLGQRIFVHLV